MCGIAGIFSYREAPASLAGRAVAMSDAMERRGPDGAGLWTSPDGGTVLAHRRLAIIDPGPDGAQPMISPEHGHVITFNGEIYNYRELTALLRTKGHRFHSTSDTEVLLNMYAEYGDRMCEHLRGMYAFAIRDARDGSLFLARDPHGIKPLYYADTPSAFLFASQVKALLNAGDIDRTPEPAAQVGFYLWGAVPEPYTFFKGVRSLPPGSGVRVTAKGMQTPRVFCSIPATLREAAQGPPVASDLAGLREALLDSVRHHLIADVPVAIFLSAGVDSQCITRLAADAGHENLRTMTVGFREFAGKVQDEAPLAKLFAEKVGSVHTTRIVERSEFAGTVDDFLHSMDQPTIDGFNTYCVSRVAREAGLKVCLSGVGGDEVFGGYDAFTQIPQLLAAVRRWVPFPVLGRAFTQITGSWIGHFTSPKYAGLFDLGRSLEGAYLLRRGMFMPWELPRLLAPEIIREGWAELQPLARIAQSAEGLGEGNAAISSLETCCYMRNQLLRDADWAGMAWSVEIRTPLVDIELLRRLAPWIKALPALRKSHVAEACGLEIGSRPKTGFTTPVRDWFWKDAENGGPLMSHGLRGWAGHVAKHVYGNGAGDLR